MSAEHSSVAVGLTEPSSQKATLIAGSWSLANLSQWHCGREYGYGLHSAQARVNKLSPDSIMPEQIRAHC